MRFSIPFVMCSLLVVVAGVSFPLIGVMLVSLFPSVLFSIVIEEVLKLVAALLFLKWFSKHTALLAGAGFGFLFGVIEFFLYSALFISIDSLSAEWGRLCITVPFHMVTVLLMVWAGSKKRWYVVPAFIVAVVLHWAFNALVR